MNFFKELILETPLEAPARSLIKLFRKKKESEWNLRIKRDSENIKLLLHNILRTDSNCVDIGANQGEFLTLFSQLCPSGEHYAFEPLPKLAQGLVENFSHVKVFNCALSNRAGRTTFYCVPGYEAWSGLQKQHYPAKVNPVEIEVEIKRFDDVIEDKIQVDFIKIDVEGAEFEVLQGAELTIKRCKPTILFEHAKIHNQEYGTTPDIIYDFLADTCGLEILELQMSRVLTKELFCDIYESSFDSNYDRNAQTNFIARPR
ncbi:FkbM family methyltransferase [Nostoc sp. C117]|uniref:FkbM family methyltransferase n=1 Tax=Nostoc sp. C117 TaxID=3349875 RepID=UPI00370D3249